VFWSILQLLPIPPFYGARLLPLVLPVSCHDIIGWLEEHAMFIFLALFVLPGASDIVLALLGWLTGQINGALYRLVA
jgi:hypothetical protein